MRQKVNPYFLFFFTVFAVYFYVIARHLLTSEPDGIYAGFNNVWSDWAVHITYARVFVERPVSDWFSSHPFYVHHPFQYHFVANFIPALLLTLNVGLVDAFFWPTILTLLGLLVALYMFYRSASLTPREASLAGTLFFLGGGIGFYVYFYEAVFTGYPVRFYTDIADMRLHWINIIISEILPQRPFLLGLTVLLFLIIILQKWMNQEFRAVKAYKLFLFGVVAASLILVHVHSFIVLVFLSIIIFLLRLKDYKKFIWIGSGFLCSFSIVYFYFFHGKPAANYWQFYPGWLANDLEGGESISFLDFWLRNWGVFIPVALFGIYRFRESFLKNPYVLCGVFLFVFANLVKVQPWAWDNTKIFTWAYLFLAIPVVRYLFFIAQKYRVAGVVLAFIIFISLCGSSILDLWKLTDFTRLRAKMLDSSEILMGEKLRAVTHPLDLVINASYHHHWVPLTTGRQQLVGYEGWLWSWGILYQERLEELKKMYLGGEGFFGLAEKYSADYIVIGPAEREFYSVNETFFDETLPLLFQVGATKVFKTKK